MGLVKSSSRAPPVRRRWSGGPPFDPAATRVDVGAAVRWAWAGGGSAHDVVAADGSFGSDYHAERGAAFEKTFDGAGVVKYPYVPQSTPG